MPFRWVIFHVLALRIVGVPVMPRHVTVRLNGRLKLGVRTRSCHRTESSACYTEVTVRDKRCCPEFKAVVAIV